MSLNETSPDDESGGRVPGTEGWSAVTAGRHPKKGDAAGRRLAVPRSVGWADPAREDFRLYEL